MSVNGVPNTNNVSGANTPQNRSANKVPEQEINVPVGQKPTDDIKRCEPFRDFDLEGKETYEEYKQAKAIYYYNNDIKTGILVYNKPIKIFGIQITEGDYTYHSTGHETLGKIKERYNLPDGSLGNQSTGGGGNYDLLTARAYVNFPKEALEKGLGIQK